MQLLASSAPPAGPAPGVEPNDDLEPESHILSRGTEQALDLGTAKALLDPLDQELSDGQTMRLTISWTIEADGVER